jgi:hypothetical protein
MTMLPKRMLPVVAAAAALLLAAGCGQTGRAHGAPRYGPGPNSGTVVAAQPANASAQAAVQATPAAGSSKAGATQPAPQTRPTPVYPQTLSTPVPLVATLSAQCVTRGSTQTLTIHTVGGYSYSFNTQYADGNNGKYVGGWGYGVVPPSGIVVSTWVVGNDAAYGTATVFVAAVAGNGANSFRQPTFKVAPSC